MGEDFERTTRVVSVVRVKRKRGSQKAAEVLFLQGKDEEEEDERKGSETGTDTNGMKRRIKKNSYTNTSNNRSAIKNIKNDDFWNWMSKAKGHDAHKLLRIA